MKNRFAIIFLTGVALEQLQNLIIRTTTKMQNASTIALDINASSSRNI